MATFDIFMYQQMNKWKTLKYKHINTDNKYEDFLCCFDKN